jgi:uncharacterized membrane protein YeaQ/YmgE (transglycosylase-associated protein family)
MDILSLIIQLASGGAGGALAGKILPKFSLGTVGNIIAGLLGGGLGGQLLGMLGIGGGEAAATGIGSIISSIAGGGVGGGVLMAIVGLIRSMIAPKG